MSLNIRLKQARKELRLNTREMSELMKIELNSYYNIESGKRGLADKLKVILATELKINLHWLITGEGNMFTVKPNILNQRNVNISNDSVIITQQQHLPEQNEQLKREIKQLKELIIAKDKIISLLENKRH